MKICFHCGDDCKTGVVTHENKTFCCNGCKTVFDILNKNDLHYYYELENTPGISPKKFDGKYDYLDNTEIIKQLIEFDENNTQIVSFLIPEIHCSSCIWVLENLNKLHPNIKTSQVNFPKKSIRISYNSSQSNLKEIVLLLCKIGYEPYISLNDISEEKKPTNKKLIYKLGVAGFAFGNIMFLSFPEYFEVNEFWLDRFKHVFHGLMMFFSLPVVFYSASDYFIAAFKGIRAKLLNIDIPIALGIAVLFLRSFYEILTNTGTGFLDSLAGLVFFLLLGKFFQQKTYDFLSFERDYKSYFPIAITKINKQTNEEIQTEIYNIKKGDHILIRNAELIPIDGIIVNGTALIDYSFVTGEAEPVIKKTSEKVYAGGRQTSGIIELEVLKPVKQSYLTQLWSNDIFKKNKTYKFENITNKISKKFTISILSIAFLATVFWLFYDSKQALNVFTSVLIVACPCAIALAAPFTLGNLLRIFGMHKLYLKNSEVIEQISQIDTLVFDKTGTLTTQQKNSIHYEGIELSNAEKSLLTSTIRSSNHPLSRSLYSILKENKIQPLDNFKEQIGQGIEGNYGTNFIKVGAKNYTNYSSTNNTYKSDTNRTAVHVSTNNNYKGFFTFYNEYRPGVTSIFKQLDANYKLIILSGDNNGEQSILEKKLPKSVQFLFNQKPEDKLNFINKLQQKGANVMMIGDGLNDSGALAQSNVGIAISENINVFSPACDGILDASKFKDFINFLKLSKQGVKVIKYAFIFSLFYNLIGLGFAITGNLQPVIAAILMPLSSISIVVFVTIFTNIIGQKLTS